MARKSAITAEAVAAAIAEIQGRGGRVTLIELRKELGGGSFSTITPFYQAWEKAQAESASLAEVEVPDQLALSGEEWLAKIWKIAVDAASAGHEGLRRELVEAREATEQARADGAEMVAVIEAERDQALELVEELNGQAATAKTDAAAVLARAVDAERELAALRERAAAADAKAERADADRAEALDRATKAEAEIATMRKQCVEDQAAIARLTAERDNLGQQIVATQKALAAADDRATKAEARADRAEGKTDEVRAELTKVAAELTGARTDLAKERAEHSGARQQLVTYSDRMERAVSDHVKAEDRLTELKGELDQVRLDLIKEQAQHGATRDRLAEAQKTETK